MEDQVTTEDEPKFDIGTFLAARKELRDDVQSAFTKVKSTKKFDRADVVKMLNKLMDLVQALDNLSDIVVNDLMVIDKRFQDIEQRIFAVGQGHTVLRHVLAEKGIVVDEDMKKTWEDKVKPDLEAKIKEAAKAAEKAEDLVVVPEAPGLLDANGNPII